MKPASALCAILLCTLVATPIEAGNPHRSESVAVTGTWDLASLYDEDADGEEAPTFGLNPKGRLILDDAGRFSIQIVNDLGWGGARCSRGSAIATRDSAGPGMLAYFGSYAVDHDTIRFRVEAGLSPRWDGSVRRADFSVAAGEMDFISSAPPSLTGSAYSHLRWRRVNSD